MPPKSKQQKMSLGTFLGDQSLGSWADEMEDAPISSGMESRGGYGSERRTFNSSASFGGDRGGGFGNESGFPPREQLPLPTRPPFTAHLGNLSFDVTSTDLEGFFKDCAVTNVRIVEDKLDRKPKGFGYVEYATLDGLKKALELNGVQFQGRNIRISVAEPPKDRGEVRELNDWTRKGPLADLPSSGMQRRPSERAFSRGFEPAPEGAVGGPRRQPFEPVGDGKTRDFSNWERKGPISPAPTDLPLRDREGSGRGPRAGMGDRSFSRRDSPSWGEGQGPSQQVPARPVREFSERPPPVERTPTAADMDTQWRTKMRPDAPPPVSAAPSATDSDSAATPAVDTNTPLSPAPPASRPRLNLQKRTVSEVPPKDDSTAAATPATPGESKASPFGAARPIDTSQREREIEEKARSRREEASKARKEEEEKRSADKAAAKAKATSRKSEGGAEGAPDAAVPGAKEGSGTMAADGQNGTNGAGSPAPAGKPLEILRRTTEGENGTTNSNEADKARDSNVASEGNGVKNEATESTSAGQDAGANGVIVDDKSVKPQEVTRDIGSGTTEGGQATTTGEELVDDGWSTVTKPTRKGRGGARAIAS